MKNKKLSFKYYQDAGHGWIAVKRDFLKNLGILDNISYYSFQKGKTVYLEEDCDAGILISTLKHRGMEFELTSRHYEHTAPIRFYDRFSLNDSEITNHYQQLTKGAENV